MNFLFLSVLVLSATLLLAAPNPIRSEFIDIFQQSRMCNDINSNENGVFTTYHHCLHSATWKLSVDGVCTISMYSNKTLTLTPQGNVPVDPTNGVPQCSKTPCGVFTLNVVDCSVAFDEEHLAQLE
ncbi:hypothetical protein CRE_20018 [Caenorhabditis remanei]|uniref:Uncharacterized protein n=1 Tax=Caenorhabditis remanei TaxID=31234 RepID=E3NCG8_CAERE|nr:hypothetical protein CRE_20018 [Caenorhabditis remanei]